MYLHGSAVRVEPQGASRHRCDCKST